MTLHVARGICYVAGCAAGLVLLDLVLDWWLELPAASRAALLLMNLAVVCILAYGQCIRYLRKYDELRTALEVEGHSGDLNTLLVSYVQFRENQPTPGVSVALIRAVRRQAAARAENVDFAGVVDMGPLRRVALVAGLAVLALVVVAVGKGPFLWTLGSRMLPPWADTSYPTRTHISVLSGDVTIRQGEPVVLEALATGEVPRDGTLWVRMAGAGWEAISLESTTVEAGEGGKFTHKFDNVGRDTEYYFRLGDARSKTHNVTAVRPPRLIETSVAVKYPGYTNLKADDLKSLNLKIPEGTQVTWRLKTDRPVVGAELVRDGAGAPKKMTVDASGQSLELADSAVASCSYRIRFAWKIGQHEYVDESVKHYIRVTPDMAPIIGLVYPMEDEKGTLQKTPIIEFWARDDYGLAAATIIYSVNDGKEQRYTVGPLGGKTSIEQTITWPIRTAVPDLREKDIVTYTLEVADGRTLQGGPLTGQSKPRRIQFVSEKEYAAYVLARQQRDLAQTRAPYLQEKEADQELKVLHELSAPGPAAPPAPAKAPASQTDQTAPRASATTSAAGTVR